MKFYITFGQGHRHTVDGQKYNADTIGVIEAENYAEAREVAYNKFGSVFCSVYDEHPDPKGEYWKNPTLVNVN